MVAGDGTDNVADTTKALEDLGNQANAVGNVMTKFFSGVQDGAKSAGISLGDVGKVIQSLDDSMVAASRSFDVQGATASFSDLQDPVDKLIGSFIKLEQVVDQSKVFQQFSSDSGAAINTVTANLGSLQKIMEGLRIPGANLVTGLAEGLMSNANESEKLENSFIALSAASGSLDKIFKDQGSGLKDLSALTAAYTNATANAADATGLSVHQSMEFANALKTIPDIMDQYITTGNKGTESTTALIASMRLMTGTGRSQADVIKAMNTAYDDLGQSQGKVNDSSQKGAEFLATISSVSTTLKLKFDDVRGVMESVAEQFKFVGDNTDAAARVLGRYTDALRETGLTSKASTDIIQGMVKGISDLSTGTKAFLSLRSGGPGGLQGAFQVEQLLRQGKLDQVVQMAEKSLKQQMGGRIFTQAEAAQSPEAASQFMRQRQLLQGGSFGIGKGMGDDQATRLLEALGRGDTLAATKEIKTGQDALTAATTQGGEIQERNNNELKSANRFLERNAIASELMAGATIRNMFGAGGANAGRIGLGAGGAMANATSSGVMTVQNEQRRAMERGGPTQADFTQQLIILGRQAVNSAVESGKGIAKGVGEGAKGVIKATEDTIDAVRKINEEFKGTGPVPTRIRPPEEPATPGAQRRNQTVRGTDTRTREDVYTRTTAGVPMMPTASARGVTGHMDATGQKPATAATIAKEPTKIILEITGLPPGIGIKRSTGNSVHNGNRAGAGAIIDIDEPGY